MSHEPPNIAERLRFHADRVEECGHLNAARYMRIAADELDANEIEADSDDGQPTEMQEWQDYDRDC